MAGTGRRERAGIGISDTKQVNETHRISFFPEKLGALADPALDLLPGSAH